MPLSWLILSPSSLPVMCGWKLLLAITGQDATMVGARVWGKLQREHP